MVLYSQYFPWHVVKIVTSFCNLHHDMINVNENYIREAHFVLVWHLSLGGARSEVYTFDCRVLLISYALPTSM